MKSIDKTTNLVEVSFTNSQQFKLGTTGLATGRKFILLPGKQKAEYFKSGSRNIPVFKYRAAILDKDNNIICIDAINLSDLVRQTYGEVKYTEAGERIPAPQIEFVISSAGNRIPSTFGEEISCGWDVRKQFVKKDGDTSVYDGVIDYPQAFEVVANQFHWVSDFDVITWATRETDDGHVAMRVKLVPIIKRIDMPEGIIDQLPK